MKVYTRISQEWAKQLLYDSFLDGKSLDWANMKFAYIPPRTRIWRIPKTKPVQLFNNGYYPARNLAYVDMDIEDVEMRCIYELINAEITQLGYSTAENLLLVGETYGVAP